MTISAKNQGAVMPRLYRTIWRWHFYAGLFCLPFVIILSITGGIYLFKPQIDNWADRTSNHLSLSAPAHPLAEQIAIAQSLHPEARLKGIELRDDPTDATRVLLLQGADTLRVYIRPDNLSILKTVSEERRFTRIIRTIHGELLAGDAGAIVVELAGAWALVMVITGLYLWWPRGNRVLAGLLYPRFGGGRFVRDLHVVTGIWISLFALFFLVSALPWTKVWGNGFKELRQITAAHVVNQDWTTGPASEHAMHMSEFQHADTMPAMESVGTASLSFDDIAAIVRPMRIAGPVVLSPPSHRHPNWQVSTDAQNRTLRVSLEIDPSSGAIVRKSGFDQGLLVDRVIGIAVSAHEGQLFGWVNQALGLMTTLGYLTLVASAVILWWRRRPKHLLGAPPALSQPARLAPAIVAMIALIGLLLPVMGISLLVVLLTERLVLAQIPSTRRWLGLQQPLQA